MNVSDLKEIRKLIETALSDDDLLNLCQYAFPRVFEQFTSGQTKSTRIRLLVEDTKRHHQISQLLLAIEDINPSAYATFLEQKKNNPSIDLQASEQKGSDSHIGPTSLVSEPCDILVLAANPENTDYLQLSAEAELIQKHLKENVSGPRYLVRVELAAEIEQLSRYLLEHKPLIIHFSGHGSSNGEIILQNSQAQAQPVSPEDLTTLISIVRGDLECIVLNACFSLELADLLANKVRCVIGIDREINDEAAIRFSSGFYRGLAFGQGYYKAFELGLNEVKLFKLEDANAIRFITRDKYLLDRKSDYQTVRTYVTRSFALPNQLPQTATLYPLWFGTNRRLVDSSNLSKGFSSERDNCIHYGSCQVAVPQSHQIGSTGSAWWKRLIRLTDDRLRMDKESLKTIPDTLFWEEVKQSLQAHDADERMALVFIHGFNVSFEEAALKAAQIGFDLQIPGMTAFYSWPSKGKLTGYTADEASIQASEPYITKFLTQFVADSGAERVHIIAHSMGNRGLLRSIQRIIFQSQAQMQIPFGQIFLAAPDEDPDVFRDLAVAYQTVAERTTLYISSKDRALATSGIIHDYPRAGFSPPITIVPGIDTIEVSNIDLTLLGHGYYGDARDLLQDMHNLLWRNTPPEQRFGLREVITQSKSRYWVIGK